MASFTDSLMQFNPYVKQLPTEAMAKVGMYKQQKYEEGVQKIQSEIDRIAGLDVVKPLHKQYLQSKLDELGGKLRNVAASDFSNFQVVNSVGGMASQIGRDGIVQNAVASTARYRKGISEMDAARKEGKSSPSNEYIFKRDADRWLNNDNLEDQFSGSFDPYTNWKKNAVEALKAMTKDQTITDDAFTVDKKGNIVLADAIVRKKYAGITPEKIQQVLMASLTPADFKQMQIDGIYTYANRSDEEIKKTITDSYTENRDIYLQKRKEFEDVLLSTTDASQKANIKNQISSIDKYIKSLESEYTSVADMIDSGNSDGAKANLYTKNALTNFSTAFSFTELSKTYETNPLAEMALKREEKNQRWLEFTTRLAFDKLKWKEEKEEKDKDRKLKEKELGLMYGGLAMPIDQSLLPNLDIEKVSSDIEQSVAKVDSSDAKFMQQNGKDQTWFDTQYMQWRQRPNSVDPTVAAYFKATDKSRTDNETNQQMLIDIRKKAEDASRAKTGFGTIDELIPKNAPNLVYTSPSLKLTVTPKDLVQFNDKFQKYYIRDKSSNQYGASGGVTFFDETAKKELSPKEYFLYNIYKKNFNREDLNQGESVIMQNATNYNKTVNAKYYSALKDIQNSMNDELKQRLTNYQGVAYGLPTMNAAQKAALTTAIVNFADFADKQKGGIANSPNFSSETLREIVTDADAKYNLTVVEGTEYQPRMYQITATGSKGKRTEFMVTPEQKLGMFGNLFEPSMGVAVSRPYTETLRKTGGYTTSTDGKETNESNAKFSSVHFPAVNTYGINANILQPFPGSYSLRLNIYDPVDKRWHTNIPFPANGAVTDETLPIALGGLNDAVIFEMLHNSPATANDLKNVKAASKKPF